MGFMRCEQLFHTSAALQKDLPIDGFLMVIDTCSRTARPAVHTIATGSRVMITLTMHDGLEPVETSSGFATTRRECSDDVALTGAGGRGALWRPSLRGRGRGPACAPLHQDCVPLSER